MTSSGKSSDEFVLYDLRVEVIDTGKPFVSHARVGDRFIHLSLRSQRDCQIAVRVGVSRIDRNRALEVAHRLVEAFPRSEHETEIVVRVGRLGVDRQCPLPLADRFIGPARSKELRPEDVTGDRCRTAIDGRPCKGQSRCIFAVSIDGSCGQQKRYSDQEERPPSCDSPPRIPLANPSRWAAPASRRHPGSGQGPTFPARQRRDELRDRPAILGADL